VEWAMPSANVISLPLSCPRCRHDGALLQIASATVLTVKCAECQHTWSVDSSSLPGEIHEQIAEATAIHR